MKKMFWHLRPFIGLVICSGLFIIGNSLANLQMPALLAEIVNNGVALGDSGFVIHTGFRMLAVAFFAVCCSLGTTYCSSRIATGFSSKLRDELFYKVQSFSEGEVDRFGTASLITRSINDVSQIQHFLMMMIRSMLSAPITAIGGVYLAFSCNAQLAMIVFAAMPLIVLIVVGISRFSIPLTRVMQKKLDQVNLVLREKLRGVRVIRAFGTEQYEEARFARANEDLTGISMQMQRTMGAMSPLVMIVLNCATVFLIYVGGIKVNNGLMPYGDIMAVVEYVMQILMSMMMISMIFIRIPRAVASAGRINAILDCETAIEGGSITDSGEVRGRLEFRNVTFSYENANEPAVKNISFTAEKGQTVAIIGSTGSGKTTLLNLIPRFYDAQEGQILIDGIDHREYDLKALRDKIGFAAQKAVLFAGSVADNIAYGLDNATREQVEHAAQIAQAEDFILNKIGGYDSPIEQGGQNLSGGQKQRISIARAVIRRPEFYLFDDSFSALDFRTDLELRRALAAETENSTVLIVAQRVSTIMHADQILVLERGELVGKGTHQQLMQTCEIYREIVLSQLSEQEATQNGR